MAKVKMLAKIQVSFEVDDDDSDLIAVDHAHDVIRSQIPSEWDYDLEVVEDS